MNDEVIAGVGFEKFLLNGHPGTGVNPHLNFRDLFPRFLGFRCEFDENSFSAVEFLLAVHCDEIVFLQVFAACVEPQFQVLIHHLAILAEVVFFHAVDLWIEDVDRVAGAQHGARIRFCNLDAHFVVLTNPQLSGFR